jgi:RNA polymerase sigma-70 factor (ECF subfamily)
MPASRLDPLGADAARHGVTRAEVLAHMEAIGTTSTLHLDDVWLALACARGEPSAVAEFERLYRAEFAGALSRLGLARADIDDVAQRVRERLFVGGDGLRPKIAEYKGYGALAGWLRAVILRAGIDLRRQRAAEVERTTDDEEPLLSLTSAADDPEIEGLRARYDGPFRDAFLEALRALPQDARNALRLNAIEGLNIEQIGVLYGVHRATVARWIAHARAEIAEGTRRILRARLGIDTRDVESLVRLCQSRLDLGPSDLDV